MPLPLENFGLDLATPQSNDFRGLHPPRNAMASQRGVGGDVDIFFVPVTVFKLYLGTCRIPQNTGYIIKKFRSFECADSGIHNGKCSKPSNSRTVASTNVQ